MIRARNALLALHCVSHFVTRFSLQSGCQLMIDTALNDTARNDTLLQESPSKSDIAPGVFLVRYGTVPEVARFVDAHDVAPHRGEQVVVESPRGPQLGSVLERLKRTTGSTEADPEFHIDRVATPDDLAAARQLSQECDIAFDAWCVRIAQWELNLELIDLEWTLDRQKLILYVLCERGPDSTKLALQAAAAGLGIIEVQPVSSTGLVQPEPSGGSCGSSGGGCGCSH